MIRPLQALWDKLCHWYLLYELNTCIYILDFPSKVCMNIFILTIVSIITYSSYVYFPPYVFTMLAFFNIIEAPSDDSGPDVADGFAASQHSSL